MPAQFRYIQLCVTWVIISNVCKSLCTYVNQDRRTNRQIAYISKSSRIGLKSQEQEQDSIVEKKHRKIFKGNEIVINLCLHSFCVKKKS